MFELLERLLGTWYGKALFLALFVLGLALCAAYQPNVPFD